MPINIVSTICTLSTVLALSSPNPTAIDLLTSLQRKHCNFLPLCNSLMTNTVSSNATSALNFTASTTPTFDVGSSATLSDANQPNQCCFQCSCLETCGQYGNCCLDKSDHKAVKMTTRSLDRQSRYLNENKGTRLTCLTPELSPNLSGISKATSYNMVASCPENALGNRQIAKCQDDFWFGDFLTEVTPVYMKNQNTLYKNVHCLSCNNKNGKRATSLEPVILCPKQDIPKLLSFDTPTEIIDYLRQSFSPSCNVMFKFPGNIILSEDQFKSHACVQPDVNVCNITGLWINNDPDLAEACENYYLPVKATMPGNTRPTTFRNLACFECNYNTVDANLQCNAPLDNSEVELRLHVPQSISQYQSPTMTDVTSGSNPKKKSCNDGQFFDVHQQMCRNTECPLGQYRLDGRCVPIFKESTSVQFQLVVKTFIKQEELESFVTNFYKTNGIITGLLSKFDKDLSVSIHSVWMKANQQRPTVVLNLTISAFATPLLYGNLLKTLQFLQSDDARREVRNHHFVFADHIYFDKNGSEAVDLIDDVELYNLQYITPNNKDNNLYSMDITEMRLCDRVELNKNEYDIENEKMHLKRAKVTLYGREYYVNRKNQTFVCLHNYINKQQNIVNELSKPENNIVNDQQEDGSEKVMRDFGFFIGCLALLMLFVAVALAKKNYLNRRLQDMRAASDNSSSAKNNSENDVPDEETPAKAP